MILYSFIIPIITCIILYIWFRRETVWWEYFVVFIPSVLGTLLIYWLFQYGRVVDTKYESYRIESIRHYDEWDEWVHKTCTRRIKTGKNSYITQTYDCSYRNYHPEYWVMYTSDGRSERISKENFDYYRNLWSSPMKFIECNRRYYRIDGDAQEYNWPGDIKTLMTVSRSKEYSNYFQSSLSLYSMEEISKNEAKELGLYNYPKSEYDNYNNIWLYDQNPIISDSLMFFTPSEFDRRCLWDLNCNSTDFRCFILLYPSEKYSSDIVDYQRSYWLGGNENEVVFCLGISKSGIIDWIRSFSWSSEARLESNVLSEILPGEEFIMSSLIDEIKKSYSTWKPIKFSDYSYISPELYTSDYIWIFIITVLINLGLSWYVIVNEYKN